MSDVHTVTQTCRQGAGLGYTACAAPLIECVYPGLKHWFPIDGPKHVWEFYGGGCEKR